MEHTVPRSRFFLLFTAFTAGTSMMSLEMCASRVLSPGFGSGIHVWGSLIGIIMAALSLGYWVGGQLADKRDNATLAFYLLVCSAILVSILPIIGPPVVLFSTRAGLVYGPLLSSIVLFALPMVLISMVPPIAIKYLAKNLNEVGGSAGLVYAVSTTGSILGTFVTAFILIPELGTRATLLINALALFTIGIVGLTNWRFTFLAALLIPGMIVVPYHDVNLLYRTESPYNIISVYDYPTYRLLKMNWDSYFFQTYMSKGGQLTGLYVDSYLVGPLVTNGTHILWIGMAGGTSPKQLVHFYNVTIDAIEIDPKVVEVARDYFNVQESERLHIYVMDGRQFLRQSGTYDIINLDVFSGADIPFHLATREFFSEAADHLNDDGVLMMNSLNLEGDHALTNALASTMKQVFPSVFISSWRANDVLIATKEEMDRAELIRRLASNTDPPLDPVISKVKNSLDVFALTGGIVLTDDRSNIEELAFRGQRYYMSQ